MAAVLRIAAAAAGALLIASCANTPPQAPRSAAAASLDAVLAGDQRPADHRARDVWRHPKETLLFFGIRPEMTVVEVWPEAGWYTEVIAPFVNARGHYYAAQPPPNPSSKYATDMLKGFADKLAARPDLYGGTVVTAFGPGHLEIAPAGSADLVVTFRNLHNWMAADFAPTALRAIYQALKPGGVLGIVEHRGRGGDQDPKARSGYVNEDYAIRLVESAGFRLAAKSEINANPKDAKDYEQGVWTLPPTYRAGDRDREKYAAIGESDRFTLKFVKPRA